MASAIVNLAELLRVTNRLSEAEPLYRRALAILEQRYGLDHPRVAVCLNNLSLLLKATNRIDDAESLSRRHLEIFLKFTRNNGREHPHLRQAVENHNILLEAMGQSPEQIISQLDEISRPFGMSLGGWVTTNPARLVAV